MGYAVANLKGTTIKWPTHEEQQEIANQFYSDFGLPQCIGAIDGTHVELDSKIGGQIDYINRKGFASMQAQVICYPLHLDLNLCRNKFLEF